jgi:hypothetical protein
MRRVPLIRGFDHLSSLCAEIVVWYNGWRLHMHHQGATPGEVYRTSVVPTPTGPPRTAKTVPKHIEAMCFEEVQVTGYRLKQPA